MVVFGQKWWYSGKSVIIGNGSIIWAKVVVFGQGGCIWAKVVDLKKRCIRAKLVVIGQKLFLFSQ